MRDRGGLDRVGDDRGAVVPPTVGCRRRGGWVILSSGVVLLLLAAMSAGLPPVPDDEGVDCGDEAALTLVLSPRGGTTPMCRDLAVTDTVLGVGMAALGIVMVGWWWLRRRSTDEDEPVDEPEEAPEVPRPRQLLPIPELRETGLREERLAVYLYTNVGLLWATAAVGPFVFLQLARTLPPVDADVTGLRWLLWEAWSLGYLILAFGAGSLLWWLAATQLRRHPVLVLDHHGLASDDQPFVPWTEVAELIFGTGRTEDDDELAVLELRLRPTDGLPTSRTVRYDLEGLTVEPEQIAALARSLHQHHRGPVLAPPEPGAVRPVWRSVAVLVVAVGLVAVSTWFGVFVAGGWPLVIDI